MFKIIKIKKYDQTKEFSDKNKIKLNKTKTK